ncbi:APC family permease [Acidaminobacterium chupaoyuni]
MKPAKEKYGLFTAITMIIGICIGSGIFFKSDNILKATGGSISLGVLVFVLAAVAIVFGGLTLSELASRTDEPGGIITYADQFCGKKTACAFGWFQTFIYYPTITAVVSWVVGIYTCILFNIKGSLGLQILIGMVFCTLCFLYNVLSPKLGAVMQNAATIIKLIPLVLLAVGGIIWGDPIAGLKNASTSAVAGATWLAAIGPIAYSYDGWVVSTSISHEVKNAKRNLPLALTIAPLLILVIYVTYFIGVTSYVGPEQVMALEDAHVAVAAENLLGSFFAKAITVFVIISVMGTVNGLVLGFIRLPYSLALRKGMMPGSEKLSKLHEKWGTPVASAIFAYAISFFWMAIHYVTMRFNLLPNSDVSEISIAISYLLYLVLYSRVIKLWKSGEIKSKMRGLICPIMAMIGSLIILSGGLQNSLFILYLALCAVVVWISSIYYKKHAA